MSGDARWISGELVERQQAFGELWRTVAAEHPSISTVSELLPLVEKRWRELNPATK